jgi:ATP-binding protein involved in chromosome partitioning
VLAEIPLVAAVGQHNDSGQPIALSETITAQSFVHLAREVIDAVDRRNASLPPTEKVNVKKS